MSDVEHIAGDPGAPAATTPATSTQAPATPVTGEAVLAPADTSLAQSDGVGVPPSPPSDTQTELAASQARITELEAKLGESKSLADKFAEQETAVKGLQAELARQRKHALVGALAMVQPDLRDMYASQIGDVDVTTDAGRAKVQGFLEAHPGGVVRTTAGERATVATESELAEMSKGNPFFNKEAYLRSVGGGMR